jgi:uncharacterized protein with HEPN domain
LPPREWRLRVDDILEAIARIERYVEGLTIEQFKADQKTVDAVIRNLEIIGESVRPWSSSVKRCPLVSLGRTSPACEMFSFTRTSALT